MGREKQEDAETLRQVREDTGINRDGDRGDQRKGSATALSEWMSWEKNVGETEAIKSADHIPLPRIPLTVAFENPVKGGLLASPTEFLSLVHQSLLHSLMSTQHHNPPMTQVDREHWTIALADLMERDGSGEKEQTQL